MSANDLYLTTEQDLTTVADAIRTRGGTSAALEYPDGFASAIAAIPGTPSVNVDEDADVLFIDYDGTPVAGRTKAQINAMTSDSDLPENPTHTGLTAQGWNWTVAQLKEQILAMPNTQVIVGQMYTTTSGATEIDVVMEEGRLSPRLTFAVNGTADIDWGDNTPHDTATGTTLTSTITIGPHNYTRAGSYTIKISSNDPHSLYASANRQILNYQETLGSENRVYTSCIKRIRIGSKLWSIKGNAFYDCYSLESITIPNTNNITDIGNSAFYNCYSLKSITLPKNIATISASAFYYCSGLKIISLPINLSKIISSLHYNNYSLKRITIPKNITKIESSAFLSCYSMSNIILPNGITEIGSSAFKNCYSLSKITIPSGVTAIESQLFSNCCGIKEFHFKRSETVPTLSNTNSFNSIATDCIFYVPYSADHSVLNAYKTASNWSTYADRMQEEPQS